MLDFIQGFMAVIILIIMAWVVWETSKMIDEKKQRQRKGLTDYYDNLIKKDNDETIS
jgi:hypothetical protein